MITKIELIKFHEDYYEPLNDKTVEFNPLTLITGDNWTNKTNLTFSIRLMDAILNKFITEGDIWKNESMSLSLYQRYTMTIKSPNLLHSDKTIKYWFNDEIYLFFSGTSSKYYTELDNKDIVELEKNIPNYFKFPKVIDLSEGSAREMDAWLTEEYPATDCNLIIISNQPEKGLDAKNQTELGLYLATLHKRGIQIILETHSEYIFDGIRIAIKEGVIAGSAVMANHLTKEGDNTVIEPIYFDRLGNYDPMPLGFFDQGLENKMRLI